MLFTEANTLKKLLIYSTTAAVIGLILTLVPLVALTLTETRKDNAMQGFSFARGLEKIEGTSSLEVQKYSVNDVAILAISFMIAFFAYALFKFRILH
jgi:hypothetical protein